MSEPPRDEKAKPAGRTGAKRLHSTATAAPSWLEGELKRIEALPPAARERFWDALGPCLKEKVPRDAEVNLTRFAKRHQAAGTDLAGAVKACRFLVRQAASRDLDAARLGEDLTTLGLSEALAQVVLGGYEPAKAQLRKDLALSVLAEHGAVVEGLEWRLDLVTASHHSERMRLPVAVLTLRYVDGDRHERLTVQLLPDALRELKRLCDRALPSS